jgi:hypothetical protein
MGTGGPFPRAKARPGRDAVHLPPYSTESRMSRSYTSCLPGVFVTCSGTALALLCFIITFTCTFLFQSDVEGQGHTQ